MTDRNLLYLVALAIAAALAVGISIYAVRSSHRKGDRVRLLLAAMMAVTALWSVSSLFAHLTVSESMTLFWFGLSNVSTFALPVVWFVFAFQYAGYGRYLTKLTVSGLLVVPLFSLGTLVTNSWHGLFFSDVSVVADGSIVDFTPGIVYGTHLTYAYAVIVAGLALITHFAYVSRSLYRRQAIGIVIAVCVPLAANIAYTASGSALLNWTPVAFAVTGAAIAGSIYRYQLLDVIPIARQSVVETMRDGVVVLDSTQQIVDVNSAARTLLNGPDDRLIGHAAESVRLGQEPLTGVLSAEETERQIERDGHVRCVTVRTTPLVESAGGMLIVLQDVTERRQRERELERTNERLDEFASVVSHDLRNPLNVASGYLDILDGRVDDEAIEVLATQHERMEHIIDDALTLAREGASVTETSTLSLEELATEAWTNVETADATLEIIDDRQLEGDRGRLLRVFENLFRNSVEHGSDTADTDCAETTASDENLGVAVAVGTTPDGFFVVDDGPGIPPEKREDIFDSGYSTTAEGTGFGLAIVEQIVAAHGWQVALEESPLSAYDGACFVVKASEVAIQPPPSDEKQ
ncbi:ATP-binding protein [Halobacteria archaeon AArc-curdl1]|uniref:histidine kinase n=1 Tax=Natronosalvus hydrolyticus TaxID=2979988 RepID=A0AAP2Z7G7_9EURY|nr:ATP-binding protein [Halobacteria archaeon AArc-curdl1]